MTNIQKFNTNLYFCTIIQSNNGNMIAVLKKLQEKDLIFVKELYDYYTLHSTVVYFIHCVTIEELKTLIPIGNERYQSFLIENEAGQPCGFCYFARFKEKEAFDISVELTIYLKPECAGQGLGWQAMEQLEPIIRRQGFGNIMALISGENEASIRLFERCGYTCCAHIREVAEKFGKKLDLKMYQKRL